MRKLAKKKKKKKHTTQAVKEERKKVNHVHKCITKGFYGDVISPIEEALHDRIKCFSKTLDKLFNVSDLDKPQSLSVSNIPGVQTQSKAIN